MRRRTFEAGHDGPLAAQVAALPGLDAAQARGLIEGGGVYVGGKRVRRPQEVVRAGQVVVVVLPSGQDEGPAPPALRVLHQGGGVLAVDKPAGLPTQPTPGAVGRDLLSLASAHLGRTAGLVHRLDRDTSGVVVFGMGLEATQALAAAFREGRARKRYLAVTAPGLPEEATIDLPLSRDPGHVRRFRATRQANGVPALTVLRRLARGEDWDVALLEPRTGRTHQLRAHLAALGFPIQGDRLYGGGDRAARCLLHALTLEVNGLHLRAPLPVDFVSWCGPLEV